jgi:uncharacterized protein
LPDLPSRASSRERCGRVFFSSFSLVQLKVIQEVLAMVVFAGFCIFYMKQRLTWDYLWASICLAAAAFFLFRHVGRPGI